MARAQQTRTRLQIRQAIGYMVGAMEKVTATSTVDDSSLLATNSLAPYPDNEINGRQLYMADAAGSIVNGETSWVSAFAAATDDATCAPAFSANITTDDVLEMWKELTVEDVHAAIDQSIIDISNEAVQPKQTVDTWSERDRYEYAALTDYTAVNRLEYVASVGDQEELNTCDTAWDAATNVTVTADTKKYRRGSACNKMVVAAAAASGALFATDVISETDCSNYDTVELWIYTDTAFTDSQLEFYLDDTAACASPTDTMSLPAVAADKWVRVGLTMTNPELDTAIISIGLGQATGVDVGACNVWIDYVRIVNSGSRVFAGVNPDLWGIVSAGATDYLKLKPAGKALIGNDALLRISGYGIPALLTSDTSTSDVDPAWVIHQTSAHLLLSHPKSSLLGGRNSAAIGKAHQDMANLLRPRVRTRMAEGTRMVQ